jgi:hypothetical protein
LNSLIFFWRNPALRTEAKLLLRAIYTSGSRTGPAIEINY